jgi:hypothetical protein
VARRLIFAITAVLLLLGCDDDDIRQIVELMGPNPTPDAARAFIKKNSIHKTDEGFKRGGYAKKLIAFAKGEATEPPHMECATRTNLLNHVLKEMGYRTRKISIFDTETNLRSHTFLDVWNDDSQRWQTHDPDRDIWWRDRTGQSVSLVDYAERLEEIEPCSPEGCGWKQAEKLRSKIDIISVTDQQRGKRYVVYTSRANLMAIYTKGNRRGVFCEVEPKRCADGFTAAVGASLNAAVERRPTP